PALPPTLTTDSKRLQQILKNLLSNAFKFTEHGTVAMSVKLVDAGWTLDHPVLNHVPGGKVVAFAVMDTGIGIAPEKQKLIFEAFHQADAGTSRKYGGTGLGLAISRELAAPLGGEIRLSSAPGEGSTFTLYLPLVYGGPARGGTTAASDAAGRATDAPPMLPIQTVVREEEVPDDRDAILTGDSVLLIVDDDPHFARVLLGLAR